jgi:quercetin dioxygenase-like cupin family protein
LIDHALQIQEPTMKSHISRPLLQLCAASALAATAFTFSVAPAAAGNCPAGQVVADGKGQPMNPTPAKDVTDTVLTRIDLVNEPVMLRDHALRLRRLVIKPGGIVPWHSHTDRPAIIYIIRGTITEYRSTCTKPIVHKAGESTAEIKGTSHWWKNTGRKTVELLSADVFHDKDDPHTM